MTTDTAPRTSAAGESSETAPYRPSAWKRFTRWLADHIIMIIALVVLVYLFIPVAYTFVFSFNNYNKSNISWNPEGSPTLKHWKNPCGAPGICDSLVVSIQVAFIATLIATVLGTMVALAARPPLWVAAVLVGAFAIFHGHAHGAELPPGADIVAYSVGFVVATGLLHLTGIAVGLLARWPAGRIAVRTAGGAIALAGVAFLSGFG